MNLYKAYIAEKRLAQREKRVKFMAALFPMAALIFCCAVFGFMLALKENRLTLSCDELNAFITDSEVRYDECVQLDIENSRLEKIITADNYFLYGCQSYPAPDSVMRQKIIQSGEANGVSIDFNGYSSLSGELSFSAEAAYADNIWSFIYSLTNSDIFASVEYSGYAYSQSDKVYGVSAVCVLKGREVQQ